MSREFCLEQVARITELEKAMAELQMNRHCHKEVMPSYILGYPIRPPAKPEDETMRYVIARTDANEPTVCKPEQDKSAEPAKPKDCKICGGINKIPVYNKDGDFVGTKPCFDPCHEWNKPKEDKCKSCSDCALRNIPVVVTDCKYCHNFSEFKPKDKQEF